jgi:chaperone modulatory protein CbpM
MSGDGEERVLQAQLLDESVALQVDEFCTRLRIEREWIVELVELGAIEPRGGDAPESWCFALGDLPRVRTMARLVQDLGVNLAGAALIVEMVERGRKEAAGSGW